MVTLMIPGRLPGLNEYVLANRANLHMGNKMRREVETGIEWEIMNQISEKVKTPVRLDYRFYEKDRRRDLDNIAGFAHKVIQDSLVHQGILTDDGWDYIAGFTDSFYVDKGSPRIEVDIVEVVG